MLVLAVDTSSKEGSLALCRDATVITVHVGDPSRTHGERLPGEIANVLSQGGVTLDDVDLYAVVAGPGSFTGLRVGIATVQGLALARGRKVVPIPALEALALAPDMRDGRIAVWRDAQRRQVFAAVLERRGDRVRELLPAVSMPPNDVVHEWLARGFEPDAFIGDGLDAHLEIVQSAWPRTRLVMPAPALAPIAGVMAWQRSATAVAPHAIVPIYVRAADAELAKQRRMKDENQGWS